MLGLCAGSLLLMVWASLGGLSTRIALLQPNRFSAMAWLVLALPAAAGICETIRRTAIAAGGLRLIGVAVIAGALLLPTYFVRESWREATAPVGAARYGVQPPEVKGSGPLEAAMVTFLRRASDDDSRVYFENSFARVHDGGHVAGMVALRSGRSLIGGPYPFTLFATAWDESAFQRVVTALEPERLSAWLDAYNVRWVLCHSPGCKTAMSRLREARVPVEFGVVTAFERSPIPGYVVQGAARVTAQCTNRVEVDHAKGARIVLRFQWVPGLRAVPSGRVSPVTLDPDLPPFVAIDDAPQGFALRLGAGDGIPCASRPWSGQLLEE
jgi:hypothetical protein